MKLFQRFFPLLLLPIAVFGQTHDISFEQVTVDNGLPSNTINCITQDTRGFLWLGTENGLCRYDGYEFKTYTSKPDEGGLSHNKIEVIYEDRCGRLLVGTAGGVDVLEPGKHVFTTFLHDSTRLQKEMVMSILEDLRGNFWFATESAGLFRYLPDCAELQHFIAGPEDGEHIPHNNLSATFQASNDSNTVWFGGFLGLFSYSYEQDKFCSFGHIDRKVMSIASGSGNELWLATFGAGLYKLDTGTGDFINYRRERKGGGTLPTRDIVVIRKDRYGRLWLGTHRDGLIIFDPDDEDYVQFKTTSNSSGTLNDNNIRAIWQDRNGVVWIGTNAGGMNRYPMPSTSFVHFQPVVEPEHEVRLRAVRAINEDSNHDLWFGTEDQGLLLYERGRNRIHNLSTSDGSRDPINDSWILTIHISKTGFFWLGTNGDGVIRLDRTTGERFYYRRRDSTRVTNISNDYVYDIFEDRDGYIWIGTWGGSWGGGLDRLDPATDVFENFSHRENDNHAVNSNIVMTIIEGDERYGDILWIGTRQGGLNRYDRASGTFRYFTHDPKDSTTISHDDVLVLYDDFHGHLWVGTNGGGLNRLDIETETFTHFNGADGLPSNVIEGILPDSHGNLWISHNGGMSRLDVRKNRFENFTISEGLQGNQFNPKSFFHTDEGEMIFGGVNGVSMFFPDSIRKDTSVPSPVITDLKLSNRSVLPGQKVDGRLILTRTITETDSIVLSYKSTSVSLEFSGLHYEKTERLQSTLEDLNQTRKQLVEQAHRAGMADVATNILHNLGNILNSVRTTASLSRDIARNSKVTSVVKANKLLRENFDRLADFIRNDPKGKKLMRFYLEMEDPLNIENEEMIENLDRLLEGVESMNQVVQVQMKYTKDDFFTEDLPLVDMLEEALALYNAMSARPYPVQKEIDEEVIASVQKNKLMKIILHLLQNAEEALDGQNEPELRVHIVREDSRAVLAIEDNGKGIEEDDLPRVFSSEYFANGDPRRFGLHSSANYATEMGGRLWVESEGVGKGAKFLLSLPLAGDPNV